jgi:hypothetical protein
VAPIADQHLFRKFQTATAQAEPYFENTSELLQRTASAPHVWLKVCELMPPQVSVLDESVRALEIEIEIEMEMVLVS